MPEKDELDRMLDSALSVYAAPAPDFEERLVQSIAAAVPAPSPRRNWLRWAIAVPAAACLLIAVSFFLRPRRRIENAQQAQSASAVPHQARPLNAAVSTAQAQARPHRRPSVSHSASAWIAKLPKRDVFPTPQPLTPAEQAFVRYVAAAPEKERRALLETQAQDDAPLEISAIKISPITIPDPSGSQGEP